jgi:hypothetical protein
LQRGSIVLFPGVCTGGVCLCILVDQAESEKNPQLDHALHFLFNFFPTYLVGLSAPSKVYEIWASEFDGAYANNNNGVYVLTMHPQVIGQWHRLVMLVQLLQYIMGHPDVWFATCSEIVADWQKQHGKGAASLA